MSIQIREQFDVDAPIDAVWTFVMDPVKVAPCLPGAKLEEVVDERNFLGGVKIKIGAISTQYKGKVELTEVDASAHRVQMAAEGRETSGGLAKALIVCTLEAAGDAGTRVVVEATADLTGKVMQVGSRMIEGVSKQLFQQFAKRLKTSLEGQRAGAAPVAAAASGDLGEAPAAGVGAPAVQPPPPEDEALSVLPLVLRTLWDIVAGFFRTLFGKKSKA
jgi:uncharacterized protein